MILILFEAEQAFIELSNQIKSLGQSVNQAMKKIAKKYEASSSEIIKFNVGGTMFSTLKTTLERKIKRLNGSGYYDSHLLQSLISGTIKVNYDENKAIFIDRNPKYFIHILDYIRNLDEDQTREKLDKASLNEFIREIEYFELNGLIDSINMIHISSVIIKTEDEKIKFRNLCGFDFNIKWTLLYRASLDGFGAAEFHRKCDGKSNTLAIIKTTDDYVFTKIAWYQSQSYGADSSVFIFSLINKENTPLKMDIKSDKYANAVYFHPNHGLTFGAVHDLQIADFSNNNRNSYSNLSHSYKFEKYTYGTNEAKQFLAGSYNFKVKEIEVFQMV
jgi:hypothetical protein